MSYVNNVYGSPEKYGLELVGQVDWKEENYSFYMSVVWKDKNGVLYWQDDAGCSCPVPFEDYQGTKDLETGSFFELEKYLQENMTEYGKAQVIELLGRLR